MLIKEKRKKRKGKSWSFVLLLIAYCHFPLTSFSQCAMCRASLESEGSKTRVEAVNDGIVFLMAVPYIIVGILAFAIYKMYYKKSSNKAKLS